MSEMIDTEAAPEAVANTDAPQAAKPTRRRAQTAAVPAKKRSHVARRGGVSQADLTEFDEYLATLGMASVPRVHINGPQHLSCVLTVDFGQPLVRPAKLTSEQSGEFVNRLRKMTRDVLAREANVRVSNDNQTGIYWTSVS